MRLPSTGSLKVAILAFAIALTGCSRAPEIVGVENPTVPTEAVPQIKRHKMFIATTRQASEVVGTLFSAERAPELGLASVVATVPPNHVVGNLERPQKLPPDPRTEFSVVDPTIYRSNASYIAAINSELAKRPPGQRKLLLFVHGYNNNVSDSVLRLAQFVEDTNYQGVPVLLTWASAANPVRYVYDMNSALIARGKLKEISNLLVSTNVESVDIFAHSMGTLLTMEGLVDAQKSGTLGSRRTINNIILASPDIDIDLFRTQIEQLPPNVRSKIYLLVSRDDRALLTSRRIAGGVPRVGAANASELEGMGVTVIDLSAIEDSSSGSHSKFAGSPEVVQLIGAGLNRAGGLEQGGRTPALQQLLQNVPILITD
ncbi:alpha/beta hydrolase [Paracoccus aestuariivivens]|uniref:Alpha/beta hydrolase n=1 Tax=Paracoccus aestuariivivens TaxID=1820333 RepID=A0A6L6J426_9RHOB|nr:alpha/beta hydrolase [Paracoccus aestuariivivens]MTH76852.1 alpha/beta hydrolase [Paracoccus aestuariivivens]